MTTSRKQHTRYNQSEKGKARKRRYNTSPKGKARKQAYRDGILAERPSREAERRADFRFFHGY